MRYKQGMIIGGTLGMLCASLFAYKVMNNDVPRGSHDFVRCVEEGLGHSTRVTFNAANGAANFYGRHLNDTIAAFMPYQPINSRLSSGAFPLTSSSKDNEIAAKMNACAARTLPNFQLSRR